MKKVRLIAIGTCPKCQAEIIRPSECTDGFCTCSNPYTLVPLKPTLIVPEKLLELYEKIAELAGVSVEELVNKVLEAGIEEWMKKHVVTYTL